MDQPGRDAANGGQVLDSSGPLTRVVLEYVEAIERLLPVVRSPADWAPLATFVAVEDFERVGTFLEVQNWQQYTEMLTSWAAATERFETSIRRTAEVAHYVYLEVEERHFRGADPAVVNSMTVFDFDGAGRIRHLDVYLQQSR